MNTNRILRMARERSGLPSQTRQTVVVTHVAQLMNVPRPVTKRDGYVLLSRWLGVSAVAGARKPKKKTPRAAKPEPKQAQRSAEVAPVDFLQTYEWRRLRMEVIKERGARCECCGATPDHGVRMNVDHIKPRKLFPALALDKSNLQVLCEDCNHGKGNWDQTDWREKDAMAPRLVRAK